MNKFDESQIEAFEVKGLSQILQVSWTTRKTNEWILEKAEAKRTLLASVKTTNLRYLFTSCDTIFFRNKQTILIRNRKRGKPKTPRLGNIMDRYGLGKSTESNGQQKSEE